MKNFHPMTILLKNEGYPPAVIASLIMHACLLFFILGRSVETADFVTIEDPVIVTASAIDINPQRLRRLERLELERIEDVRHREQAAQEAQREREAREQREAEARRQQQEAEAERQRQEDIARRAEADRIAAEEAERLRLAEEARLQDQQRLVREQAARDAQASQLAGEQLIVAEYVTIIRRVISQNWQIPPSARNGMTAVVQLQVVPTGEVVGTFITQSSGNAAFDRSVVQAVERAERFPELQDLDTPVFERNFRSFTLVFRPEDLLR